MVIGGKADEGMLGPPAPNGGRRMPRRAAEGIELLADPTRRRIIALIADRVWHPADIAQAIELSRPAVSRQLRLLTDAGLVRWRWSRIDLRSREYFIDPAMQPAIIAWLAGVDLRSVRPICRPDWSPPMRVRRRRRDVRALGLEHEGFG
jgi:DNA-binding transcriptional ArsR family regulator